MAHQFMYERIAQWLRERIASGEYSVGQKLPSAKDLAIQFNTSTITANKALNHLASEGKVHRSTGLGSVVDAPKALASNNMRNQNSPTKLIGVIVFDVSHPFWAGTIRGIEEKCRHYGYNLLIGNDEGNLKKAESYLKSFIARGVEGLIFVPIGTKDMATYEEENRKLLVSIEQSGLPYVLLHRRLETFMAPVAQLENVYSAYEATRLLLKQNVSNPICISHYYSQVTLDREKGFLQALHEAGYEDAPKRVFRLHPVGQTVDIRELHEVLQLMERKADVDAILTITADMLVVILQAMKQSNHWKAVKLVSYDFNLALFRNKNIIAMMETPAVEMGMQSASLLFRRIRYETPFRMQTFVCPEFHIKKDYADNLDGKGYLVREQVRLHD